MYSGVARILVGGGGGEGGGVGGGGVGGGGMGGGGGSVSTAVGCSHVTV